MRRDQRHTNAYIFGAVCPARDKGAALVLPEVNPDAMNLHLAEIAKEIRLQSHAVIIIIIDGAGWHKSDELKVPENISLLRLPPYSPELNAQENIGQYLRQNFLAGRIFDTYDAIVDACCDVWNALTADTNRIASISTRDWLSWITS
jgi:transposase